MMNRRPLSNRDCHVSIVCQSLSERTRILGSGRAFAHRSLFTFVVNQRRKGLKMSMVISSLNPYTKDLARRTMSAWAFYYIVGDALINKKPLSTVRMGDGERTIIDACVAANAAGKGNQPIDVYDQAKRLRMGIDGITYNDLYRRLLRAGNECTHFCPSVSGLTQDAYALHQFFHYRDQYVDNFFVNIWDTESKATLFRTAERVLLIHANPATADAMQINCQKLFGVRVDFIQMSAWQQAEKVVERACAGAASLVLFAAGPASKYISSEIANNSNKVCLDLGNTTDFWTFADVKA